MTKDEDTKKDKPLGCGEKVVAIIIILAVVSYCMGDRDEETKPKAKQEKQHIGNEISSNRNINDNINQLEKEFRQKATSICMTFRSKSGDRESHHTGEPTETYNVTSYHQFDFGKNVVTKYLLKSDGWTTYTFPFKSSDVKKDPSGYITIKVNSNGVKEIWFSIHGTNMGYDYHDRVRWAFYELSKIE